jgi:ribosomal protein L37AE/L43A
MDAMDSTIFTFAIVFSFVVFAISTALVRTARAKEHLKKHPIKKCPFCAEIVKFEARVCKHCGRDFASTAPVVQTPKARFYYHAGGQQQGPFDGDELKLLWQEGVIKFDTPVIREGDSQWGCIQDFFGIMGK